MYHKSGMLTHSSSPITFTKQNSSLISGHSHADISEWVKKVICDGYSSLLCQADTLCETQVRLHCHKAPLNGDSFIPLQEGLWTI